MAFKFEKLEVWQLAVEYVDLIYRIAAQLPRSEEFNLKSQIIRVCFISLESAGRVAGCAGFDTQKTLLNQRIRRIETERASDFQLI